MKKVIYLFSIILFSATAGVGGIQTLGEREEELPKSGTLIKPISKPQNEQKDEDLNNDLIKRTVVTAHSDDEREQKCSLAGWCWERRFLGPPLIGAVVAFCVPVIVGAICGDVQMGLTVGCPLAVGGLMVGGMVSHCLAPPSLQREWN